MQQQLINNAKAPKKWSYLKEGDIIDIVATTPGIKIETLEKDLAFLVNLIKTIGIIPRFNFNSLLNGASFFSNQALEIRKQDFHQALFAEDSKAIWFIRGGYGTSNLLSDLTKTSPKPKLLIGYSDINCIHLWANQYWQWSSLHARVLYEFLDKQNLLDFELTKKIIFGEVEHVHFDNLIPLNEAAKEARVINGVITGGTMQVLQSGIGLPWQFNPDNKILFLEEIFDRGVRIERTLNHFYQLGLFKNVKAVLFGDIICQTELDGSQTCEIAIKHFSEKLNIPALSITKLGHGKFNHPLPLNTPAELTLNNRNTKLICSSGGA